MVLSNKQIRKALKDGLIIIHPFTDEHVSTSSYDVTLGEYYFEERERKLGNKLYNPYDKEAVDRIWGIEPIRARMAKEIFEMVPKGIGKNDQVILLEAGETVLAHTTEFIGGRDHITTMMKARSSLGRNFIEVCKCAGWGDVGYVNRWTMEITNNSRYHSIPLVVGRRVAQIIFFETGPVEGGQYEAEGKYQTDRSPEHLPWDPLSMLPKLYKDKEVS